jgi:hypothetical protein
VTPCWRVLAPYGRLEKTQRQAGKDSKAGKKRLKGRQEKTQRQARKDSKAGKKRLKGRQEETQRQARKNSFTSRQHKIQRHVL